MPTLAPWARPTPGAKVGGGFTHRSASRLLGAVPVGELGLDLVDEAREVDGLGVVVVAAGLEGLLAVAGHGVRREGDDRDGAGERVGLEAPGRFPAVDDGK